MSLYMKFLTLNNGYEMPILGLGTFQAEKGKIKYIVENAINLGYKSIDCAWLYGNEKEIGDALEFELKDGKIKREELFITSKLWNTFHHPNHVSVGFNESLNNLKLDYLDLYLIHWPLSMKFGSTFPTREEDFADVDSIATWKEMEKLVDSKKVKSIGLSNFNIRQIQYILDHCRIKPAVLQIELHVYLQNKKLVEFCLENGIQVTAYSPLGGDFTLPEGTTKPIDDPKVIEMATKYNASPAQILLSYIMHRGISCIPKSSSAERLEENIKSTKLELSDEDFHVLDNFNVNFRLVSPKIYQLHKDFPFGEDVKNI